MGRTQKVLDIPVVYSLLLYACLAVYLAYLHACLCAYLVGLGARMCVCSPGNRRGGFALGCGLVGGDSW